VELLPSDDRRATSLLMIGAARVNDLGHTPHEREAIHAARLAVQGRTDTEIGWELAEMRADQAAHAALAAQFGPEFVATLRRPVRRLSGPTEPVNVRTVRRRVRDGRRLGVRSSERGRDRQDAIRAAERAWLAHDERLQHLLGRQLDPSEDAELHRLTAGCWRAAADVYAFCYAAGAARLTAEHCDRRANELQPPVEDYSDWWWSRPQLDYLIEWEDPTLDEVLCRLAA
jgi:hypothetical protein